MMFLRSAPIQIDDLTPDALQALVVQISAYIKAGGILTPDMWERMEPVEKSVYAYIQNGGVEKEMDALHQAVAAVEARNGDPK